jgi:PAS domain S-box-containing protein
LLLLLINFCDRKKKFAKATGLTGYVIVVLITLAMIHRMGGVNSPYYVGLILAMTIYAALAPLTTRQTLLSGLLVVGLYTFIVAAGDTGRDDFPIELFANLFFMSSVVIIVATQSWADTRARQREYQLRVQESEVAEQLSRQAEELELEVEKRSREQAASEARYRLLFNQIADDVVLVTAEGEILQANSNFSRHYLPGQPGTRGSLFAIIPSDQHQDCRTLLAMVIDSGEPVRNRQLNLIRPDGSTTEAEVSASLLRRDHGITGILLVIRDMSIRKEMERQLLTSLEMRKKNETATILALAKLSEFRDYAAGNHLERIREYCRILATELSSYSELQEVITPTYIEDIYHASILHDIGKVAIPDRTRLQESDAERHDDQMARRHTITGGDVIREMQEENRSGSFLDMAKHIAYFHHERWDGKGYPHGLMERQIPLAARIMAVADAYEEMTAATPDNPAVSTHDEAVIHIAAHSGSAFDPMVVGAFMMQKDAFRTVRENYSEMTGNHPRAGHSRS